MEKGMGAKLGTPWRVFRHSETGAALTEFALIVPLLIMLLFGIVSVGVAYNHQLSLTHAAREAGRHGATLPVANFNATPPAMDAWLDDLATRIEEDATGSLGPGTPGLWTCVAYVHPDGNLDDDSTRSRTDDEGNVTYANAACFADGRPTNERRVQVRVAREVDFNLIVFAQVLTLDSEAVSRFEARLGI
jgi:hypothetical protein